PSIVSFHFGLPSSSLLSRVREWDTTILASATTIEEAEWLEANGADAVIAQGIEAGGHRGMFLSDDLTTQVETFLLLKQILDRVNLPVIAAGGIGTGRTMLAALALGADGVQIGSRFVATTESSAHENFKAQVIAAKDDATKLTLKQLIPVRLIWNKFLQEVEEMEKRGASKEELAEHLGRGRAKLGMFEGDIHEGEMEIGQIAGLINKIKPAGEIINEIVKDFELAREELSTIQF
ncbi:MAG: nitronate monooxygenase, partial [Bacteroidetes bacterium]|nr:nitronate monooxygenase [Bacteroidota bacterium]